MFCLCTGPLTIQIVGLVDQNAKQILAKQTAVWFASIARIFLATVFYETKPSCHSIPYRLKQVFVPCFNNFHDINP